MATDALARRAKALEHHAAIDATLKRIANHKGVVGYLVINPKDGSVWKAVGISDADTVGRYARNVYAFVNLTRSVVRCLDPLNDLAFLRMRSIKYEFIIAPEKDFVFVVIQEFKDYSGLNQEELAKNNPGRICRKVMSDQPSDDMDSNLIPVIPGSTLMGGNIPNITTTTIPSAQQSSSQPPQQAGGSASAGVAAAGATAASTPAAGTTAGAGAAAVAASSSLAATPSTASAGATAATAEEKAGEPGTFIAKTSETKRKKGREDKGKV